MVKTNDTAGSYAFVRTNHLSYDSAGNLTGIFAAPGLGVGPHTRYLGK